MNEIIEDNDNDSWITYNDLVSLLLKNNYKPFCNNKNNSECFIIDHCDNELPKHIDTFFDNFISINKLYYFINISNKHWCLIFFQKSYNYLHIYFYDSLNNMSKIIKNHIIDKATNIYGNSNISELYINQNNQILQQDNSSCGLYVFLTADYIRLNNHIPFFIVINNINNPESQINKNIKEMINNNVIKKVKLLSKEILNKYI